jgi:PAS domain S-box-containing protein
LPWGGGSHMAMLYPATKSSRKNGGRDVKVTRSRRLSNPSLKNNDLSYLMAENSCIITERRLTEALQIEKNKLQSVIDSMTDTLTIMNHDFDITFQNARSRARSGDHLGEKCYRAYEHREKVCEGCPVEMAFQDGMPHTSERKNIRSAGGVAFWENTANPVKDASGKVIMCLEIGHEVTERKKTEEKRQAILQTALDGFWICDLQGRFLEVNDSYCTMIGYTREELLKMAIKDIEAIEKLEETTQRIKKIIEQGSDRFETQHKCKDGRIIDIEIRVKYHNIDEGQLFVFVRDITEQNKAEEQLRLLSSVTQQVSDAIMITDSKFKITYSNQAAQDMFGYTIDEIKGKDLASFHITSPAKKANQAVRETIHQGKVWYQTIPKKRKDGSIIICDCHLSPLCDDEGKVCSYIDVQRDVTKKKEVEAKLRAQKQLIESILATMREGVLVIDSADRIILANTSAHRILHRRPNTMKNKPFKDIIPVEPLLNLYQRVKLGTQEDNTLEFMYGVNHIDKIIACGAVKMDDERTLLTFSDVSRESEEKEKLYLTDRLASIGEMAVGLAHELNNPLTGILSLSQLLIDSDIPPDSKEDLKCINSEARRAASIVKNVLLFTRNNNYENGQASVNEVVRDVLRLREYEEKANSIKVVTNLQENLPKVQIDRFQLQQVFLNIILNAEAAIKEANRPGLLTVTTEKVNHHVNILFSDNGCGIKKNVLSRIFDPFFTTKEIGKGTGLGLSICFGIVTQHRGKISVRTQVDKGTTFTVRIPLVLEQNT